MGFNLFKKKEKKQRPLPPETLNLNLGKEEMMPKLGEVIPKNNERNPASVKMGQTGLDSVKQMVDNHKMENKKKPNLEANEEEMSFNPPKKSMYDNDLNLNKESLIKPELDLNSLRKEANEHIIKKPMMEKLVTKENEDEKKMNMTGTSENLISDFKTRFEESKKRRMNENLMLKTGLNNMREDDKRRYIQGQKTFSAEYYITIDDYSKISADIKKIGLKVKDLTFNLQRVESLKSEEENKLNTLKEIINEMKKISTDLERSFARK